MKKHNWHVRAYQKGDEAGIVKLMNLEPRLTAFSLDRWDWRYKKNPYGFLAVVGESDSGEIVGHLGMYFLKMKVGNKTVIGSQAGNLVVHPNFRRQGMFLTIGRQLAKLAAKNNAVLTYIFPNAPAPYHGHIKYGYFDIQMIPTLVSYVDFHRATNEKTSKIISTAAKFSPLIDYLHSKKRSRLESNLQVTQVDGFGEEINQLWNRISHEYDLIVVREKDYLNWRYFECPEWHYNVLVAEKNNVTKGFLVTSVHKVRTRIIGYIVDFLCDSNETLIQLVAVATCQFNKQRVDSIKCLQSRWSKILQKYGFASIFQPKFRMCGRINSPSFSEAYKRNAKGWFVNYGDCDFI